MSRRVFSLFALPVQIETRRLVRSAGRTASYSLWEFGEEKTVPQPWISLQLRVGFVQKTIFERFVTRRRSNHLKLSTKVDGNKPQTAISSKDRNSPSIWTSLVIQKTQIKERKKTTKFLLWIETKRNETRVAVTVMKITIPSTYYNKCMYRVQSKHKGKQWMKEGKKETEREKQQRSHHRYIHH